MSCVWKSSNGQETVHAAYRSIIAGAPVPLESRMVPGSFGETHVLAAGRKGAPALVFLHGSMSVSASWFGILPVLAKQYRLYLLDLPGEPGLSSARRLTMSSSEPRQWLEEVLAGLDLERCGLVGMSLGGWFALNLATACPEKVQSLALIASAGIVSPRASFLPRLILASLGGPDRVDRLVWHKTAVPAEAAAFARLVAVHFKPLLEALPLFTDAALRNLIMPVYWTGGSHDAMLDCATCARRLANLVPHARMELRPDAGHVIIDFQESLERFLADNP